MKRNPLAGLLLWGWVCFAGGYLAPASLQAAASDPSHGPVKVKDAHADAPKKEDPTAFIDLPKRYDLGIWTLVVFGLLLYLLSKTAFPMITDGLRRRDNYFRTAKEEAEKALADAQELQTRLQNQLAEANDKIRGMIEEARRDAEKLREQIKAEAQAEAQAERERAQREIAVAKDQALQEVWSQAVQIATLMSSKAIQRSLTIDDHQRLLQEALAELQQANLSRA